MWQLSGFKVGPALQSILNVPAIYLYPVPLQSYFDNILTFKLILLVFNTFKQVYTVAQYVLLV